MKRTFISEGIDEGLRRRKEEEEEDCTPQ